MIDPLKTSSTEPRVIIRNLEKSSRKAARDFREMAESKKIVSTLLSTNTNTKKKLWDS